MPIFCAFSGRPYVNKSVKYRVAYRAMMANLEGNRPLERRNVYGMIILKCILKR
jgi:hypothetical protein